MQISMVAENLLQPSDGYRKPSATVKMRKQMRKPKQKTSVFLHTAGDSGPWIKRTPDKVDHALHALPAFEIEAYSEAPIKLSGR